MDMCRDGLVDPHGAEIHLVVRTHGEKVPGMVKNQINTKRQTTESHIQGRWWRFFDATRLTASPHFSLPMLWVPIN